MTETTEFIDFGSGSSSFPRYVQLYNSKARTNKFQITKKKVEKPNNENPDIRHQLIFLMDATGSMSSYIQATKTHIQNMVLQLRSDSIKEIGKLGEEQETKYNLAFEISCICYRDLSDSNEFETLDFTEDVDEFKAFLSTISATGGGDFPEDVVGAFLHGLYGLDTTTPALSWDARGEVSKRSIVFLADAPGHGYTGSANGGDSYPDAMEDYWKIVFKTLAVKDVALDIVKVNNSCTTFHEKLKELGVCYGVQVEIIDISQEFASFRGGPDFSAPMMMSMPPGMPMPMPMGMGMGMGGMYPGFGPGAGMGGGMGGMYPGSGSGAGMGGGIGGMGGMGGGMPPILFSSSSASSSSSSPSCCSYSCSSYSSSPSPMQGFDRVTAQLSAQHSPSSCMSYSVQSSRPPPMAKK